ncbi:hypothetical protein V7968_23755 [Nocardia vulneris]|uniref:hypothetical protein n=1 Tax=Nocardia vulneris TaxID=1141657 RepID=UPI0030D05BD6
MAHQLIDDDRDLTVQAGVARMFEQFGRIGHQDFVILAYTPECRIYAAHAGVFLDSLGVGWASVPMAPLLDAGIGERLTAKLPSPAGFVGNLVVATLERDTMSHFEVFTPLFDRYGIARTKILRVISASDDFFRYALAYGPEQLERLNATLLAEFSGRSRIRVTAPGGTDLDITLDQNKYDWISNRGRLRPGAFTILPPGEIATFPARVDGVLVADGAVNCNVVTELDMRLAKAPITFQIEDSSIRAFDCPGTAMNEFLQRAFTLPHARKVGELGFGTNQAIPSFVAHNSHMNERRSGLHIGFGQHNQPLSVVGYDARIHIDVITDDATIHFDNGRTVTLSRLIPAPGVEHPQLIRDEDITGDCCSSGCARVSIDTRR